MYLWRFAKNVYETNPQSAATNSFSLCLTGLYFDLITNNDSKIRKSTMSQRQTAYLLIERLKELSDSTVKYVRGSNISLDSWKIPWRVSLSEPLVYVAQRLKLVWWIWFIIFAAMNSFAVCLLNSGWAPSSGARYHNYADFNRELLCCNLSVD